PTIGEPAPVLYVTSGAWVSQTLDSEIARCTWHRVVLEGILPAGTRIQVMSQTSESEKPPETLALEPDEAWQSAGIWRAVGDAGAGSCERQDYLLRSPPGRYLWLKLVLGGDGNATPRLASLEIEFPRISLRRYLPAVFGAEPVAAEFTDRWLAIFDR